MAPRAPITAPPARPPRYGLLAAAPTVADDDLRVLASGWGYQPEGCGLGGIEELACAGNVTSMVPGTRPSEINGDPVWIWASDECSTFGHEARDWEGRARRQLAAVESFQLALELWDGTIATAAGSTNWFFSGNVAWSDTVTSGPSAIAIAVANVEAGLASLMSGQPGMIHMTPQVLTHAAAQSVIRREGNVWVSPMGHVVVADAGYSGDGPGSDVADATSQWIFGSPMLQIRLGPIEIIPGSLNDARNLAASMDRQVNDITVFAGRLAGVQWANHCGLVAAEVDYPIALIGGVS